MPTRRDIVEAILRGDELEGISLSKLHKNLPVRWDEQRERWNKMIWVMQPALASRASVFGEGPLHEVCAKKREMAVDGSDRFLLESRWR